MALSLKSLINEISFHFQLFRIRKEDIRAYFASPYRILTIVLFSILFLPHAFVVVKDINFVLTYEVDPGSIISSILALYNNHYNMNLSYHSQYYGWTYFSINYVILAPVYFLVSVLRILPIEFFFISIRVLYFLIGLACIFAFFEVANYLFKSSLLSFIAVLFCIAGTITSRFFYYIHPETTGLLFLFLSILCLLHYNKGQAKDHRWYTYGLLSLTLSALSKQPFILTAIPVIFLFIFIYCFHRQVSFFRFLITKQFLKVLCGSIILFGFIFFIINPFAFIQVKIFIANQISLIKEHTQGDLTRLEAFRVWLKVIQSNPVIGLSLALFPFSLPAAIMLLRNQKVALTLYLINIISAVLFSIYLIISVNLKLVITSGSYFAPVYPSFIINLLSIVLFVYMRWKNGIKKIVAIIPLSSLLFFILLHDFSISIPLGYYRFMYQNTAIYKIYTFIGNNIPAGSKITHDQYVAIPADKKILGCSYWQECDTYQNIEKFQPDYIIYNEDGSLEGTLIETAMLTKYVKDYHFILVNSIKGFIPFSRGLVNIKVSIWKKPNY